jgi:hypothetical protein
MFNHVIFSRASVCLGTLLLISFLAPSIFAQGMPPAPPAPPAFNAAFVKGVFAMQESGNIGEDSILSLGVLNLSGSGTASGTASGRWAGNEFVTATFTGTYTINADGTGTMQLNFSYPQTVLNSDASGTVTRTAVFSASYSLVIVSSGQLRAIRTSGGQSVTVTLDKQVTPTT